VILYELLAGRLPFIGDPLAVLSQALVDPPPAPSTFRLDLDRELEMICLRAMAKKIEDRYGSMAELARALQCYLGGQTLTPEPGRATAPGPETPGRRIPLGVWLGGGGITALVLLGSAVFFVHRSMDQDLPRIQEKGKEHEQEPKQQVAADALAHVRRSGQAIIQRAYPLAIGGVTYNNGNVEGIARRDDGYEATVRLNYSNALGAAYFLEVLVSYDWTGNFRSWRIGRYNDPFPPSLLGKTFDQWPN
jgi:hypothetical protein